MGFLPVNLTLINIHVHRTLTEPQREPKRAMTKPSLCQVILLLRLSFVTLSRAQYGGGRSKSSSSISRSTSSLATTGSASSAIQTVDVGEDGFVYTPDTHHAGPGDKIESYFYPGNHSVAQASFDNPHHPMSDTSFFSRFVPSSDEAVCQVFSNITTCG